MNTRILNKYIQDVLQLPGVTAKVFRTAKASSTFQDQLKKFTNLDGDVLTKLKSFHQASLFVAKLCNHFRALPKSSSMAKMETGMDPKVEDKTIEYEQISIKTYKMNYIDPRISVAWSKNWQTFATEWGSDGSSVGRLATSDTRDLQFRIPTLAKLYLPVVV